MEATLIHSKQYRRAEGYGLKVIYIEICNIAQNKGIHLFFINEGYITLRKMKLSGHFLNQFIS